MGESLSKIESSVKADLALILPKLMKSIVPLYIAWIAAVVMLFLAVSGPIHTRAPSGQRNRHHYHSGYNRSNRWDFYTVLRWICCAAFAYSAVVAGQMQLTFWTWAFGLLAILFNPIIPIYLQRQFWQIIDYAALVIIFLASIVFTRNMAVNNGKTS
jgi:FtsH-binding integral membrane protein